MSTIRYLILDLDEQRKPTIAETFGGNVRAARVEQNMSVAELSRMSGIGRPLLKKIESGAEDVRLSYVKRLADFLGVTPADLLTPHQNRPPE